MGKLNNEIEKQVQMLVLDYFNEMDDKTISDVVDSFVYNTPITDKNSKVSKIIEKFLDDNGLTNAYTNYLSDLQNPQKYFFSASLSDVDTIEKIKHAMLNMSYNRFRALVTKRDTNFTFLRKTVLEIINHLNNNENYFYGKDEDEKLVEKVKAMKS